MIIISNYATIQHQKYQNSVPAGTELKFSVPLASVERSRPGVIICGDKMRYRIKMLSKK